MRWWWWWWWWFINSLSFGRKRMNEKRNMKKEDENENEEYYLLLPVLFDENFKSALELFFAAAGFERNDSRFVCILACDSFETGFLDGTLLTSLEPKEPCIFGAR